MMALHQDIKMLLLLVVVAVRLRGRVPGEDREIDLFIRGGQRLRLSLRLREMLLSPGMRGMLLLGEDALPVLDRNRGDVIHRAGGVPSRVPQGDHLFEDTSCGMDLVEGNGDVTDEDAMANGLITKLLRLVIEIKFIEIIPAGDGGR
jgi:hypothetical protein